MQWLGHVIRMDIGKITKKLFDNKLDWKKKLETQIEMAGGCRKGYKSLNIRRWRQKDRDRQECANLLRKSKFSKDNKQIVS